MLKKHVLRKFPNKFIRLVKFSLCSLRKELMSFLYLEVIKGLIEYYSGIMLYVGWLKILSN